MASKLYRYVFVIILMAIFMCNQFIKLFHIVEDLRLFPYIGLGVASVSENWHFANPLARSI